MFVYLWAIWKINILLKREIVWQTVDFNACDGKSGFDGCRQRQASARFIGVDVVAVVVVGCDAKSGGRRDLG